MSVQLIPTVLIPPASDKPPTVIVADLTTSLVPTIAVPQPPAQTFMYIPIPTTTIPYTGLTITPSNFYYFLIPFIVVIAFIIAYIFHYRSKKRTTYVPTQEYAYD